MEMVDKMYVDLGKRIRQQRIIARKTQEKLSDKVGISLSFLGHIERGTRKASLDTLVRICNALKVSADLLLQDSLDKDLLGFTVVTDGQSGTLREFSTDVIDLYSDDMEKDE